MSSEKVQKPKSQNTAPPQGEVVKDQEDQTKLLALILIGIAILLIIFSAREEKPKVKSNEIPAAVKSEKFEASVNKHLMLTNEAIEMQRQRAEIENARLTQELENSKSQQAFTPHNESLDFSTENRSAEIANIMGRGEKATELLQDPRDIVQKELFNKQQMDEYSKAYREEYARQFVENARRGGYLVKLSADYRVLSVTPIRKPIPNRNEKILNPNSSGLE